MNVEIKYVSNKENETLVKIINDSYNKCVKLFKNHWGLDTPKKMKIYIVDSYLSYIKYHFLSSPFYMQTLYILFFPGYIYRWARWWPKSFAWTDQYKMNPVLGIKSIEYFSKPTNNEIGKRVFNKENDIQLKIELSLCHTMLAYLLNQYIYQLWFVDGLCLYSRDLYSSKQIININTLDDLHFSGNSSEPKSLNYVSDSIDDFVYSSIRGYWIIKYIESLKPGFLRSFLSSNESAENIIERISEAINVDSSDFWSLIDSKVYNYFKKNA